jgi:hypothetical protein
MDYDEARLLIANFKGAIIGLGAELHEEPNTEDPNNIQAWLRYATAHDKLCEALQQGSPPSKPDERLEKLYKEACGAAQAVSLDAGCKQYVYAVLRGPIDGTPHIETFLISDFFDESTVATYSNGKRV